MPLMLKIEISNVFERREMPGHVKRGGTGEPDPDPTEYLFITYEEKQKVSGQYFVCETIDVLGPFSCKAVLLRTFFISLIQTCPGPCKAVRPEEELLVPVEGGRLCRRDHRSN